MQFHREFQSFLCDHIPLRKSIAWQDWYASGKYEVQADEITFSMGPGSHSKSLVWVVSFSPRKLPVQALFQNTSLEAAWFNHVPGLLWCDFSDSCYYLSGWTGTKKSLMLDTRKERARMWAGHSPVTHHPKAPRLFQPFPFLTNILIFMSSAASSNMRYQLSLKCN